MCVSPYIVEVDGKLMPVPCGKCIECLRDFQNEWAFRLTQEVLQCRVSWYLTLTYDPEHSPVAYNDEVGEWQTYVDKRDIQLFLKRVRKNYPELSGCLRYFAVGEYGGDYNRAHYHLVLCSPVFDTNYWKWYKLFFNCWNKGFIKLKNAEERNIGYVTKYLNKLDKSPHITKPFRLMSKGLGLCYLTDKMVNYFFNSFATGVRWKKGFIKLPRYYKKKLDEFAVHHPRLARAGLTFSDVLRFQDYHPKGLQEHFKYFCDNFAEIYRDIYRSELQFCRKKGFILPENLSRMQVFKRFCCLIDEIVEAQHVSARKIEDIKVRHKFTRITQRDIKKCRDYSIQSPSRSRNGTNLTFPLNHDFLRSLGDSLP